MHLAISITPESLCISINIFQFTHKPIVIILLLFLYVTYDNS